MFTITVKDSNRSHTTIKKIISKVLLEHKDILPSELVISLIKDNNITLETSTGIDKNLFGYIIDFNLIQIYNLYKGKEKIQRCNTKHLPKFKKFKDYLLFVLFHELGHYDLKHFLNPDKQTLQRETVTDIYSLKLLGLYHYQKETVNV